MKPRIAAAILLLLGVAVHAQEHGPTGAKSVELHLRATVEAVVPLTDFSGKVTPVDFAPSFALTVRVETVKPTADEFVPGSEITFAIHSPALLFEGDTDKSLAYDFYLVRETKDGKVRFNGLSTHRACAEDDIVGYPLNGWVGYTNTGDSVSDMTVTARTRPHGPTVATATTDSTGRFSFPTLGPGKFYLKATKKLVDATVDAEAVITVKKRKHLIACLVAEAEMPEESSPQ
jgi:carboxypeptidase family protein